MVRTFVEAFGIFAVSLMGLFIIYVVANSHKATGIGWLHWKGMVLMFVGVLYFVTGLVMRFK